MPEMKRDITLWNLLRFARLEAEQHLLRKRWLLPWPLLLFIAYITLSGNVVQSTNWGLSANSWDALFSVFGNGNVLFFVVTPLFLYLVSDMLPEPNFGQSVLLRLGSRRRWWVGKTLAMGVAVAVYSSLSVGIVASLASFVLPWQSSWSQAASRYPLEFYLSPRVLTLSPPSAFAQLLFLLTLGWFGLGLLVMVVAQRLRHSFAGFTAGVFVNIGGLAASKTYLAPPYAYLFIHQHLVFNLHAFAGEESIYPTVSVSVLFWLVWLVIFFVLGWRWSLTHDFLPQEQDR